jgi:hypothetical protein
MHCFINSTWTAASKLISLVAFVLCFCLGGRRKLYEIKFAVDGKYDVLPCPIRYPSIPRSV